MNIALIEAFPGFGNEILTMKNINSYKKHAYIVGIDSHLKKESK